MALQSSPKETEWQTTEDRFRLLVESVEDYGIFTLDPAGHITSWNEGARRMKGYEADDIVGSHFSRFYTAEDIANGKPQWELEEANRVGRVEDEGWRVRKDGTRFWADVVITAMRDTATGKLVGFGKVTRDLTERRDAEERLRRSEEQFRLLVESVNEYAIFMLDPTGHVMSWNAGAQNAKGYKVEEILGSHFSRFYTVEDCREGKPARLLEEARTKGHVRDQGVRVRKDGSIFEADVLITAMTDPQGNLRGFSKVTRDVTDQRRIREMEAAQLAAEKASKAKDDFLAVLSHELRTPLTPVLASVNYLAEQAGQLNPGELQEELKMIRRNVRLEAQLIDDLLDLTRISQGKMEMHCEVVDVHAMLQEVWEIVREDLTSKGLVVSRKLAATEHWTWGDAIRLRQALWNLLNNAVKFTPRGGRIAIRTANEGPGVLRIIISDTGVGIQPQLIDRIFNAFEQGEHAVRRQFGGLGLGLAITQSVITNHGGTISVRSEGPDKGATFCVELRSVPAPSAEVPVASVAESKSKLGLRILLVDDHEDTRRVLARLLTKRGHEVKTAAGAVTAMGLLEGEKFDLLVSDIGLPDGSGHEVMSAARTRQPWIQGVALSGFGMQEDLDRSTQAGFGFHVIKPVDISALDVILDGLVPIS